MALRDWLGEAKAKQVYLVLRDRILSGAVAFGTKLPTEHELAAVHDVSRVTLRRALGELARERLIDRLRSAAEENDIVILTERVAERARRATYQGTDY
ncbi:MAG: winged helix-turn-helix domain-containing protein [Xanthobacteraceae bacterium]